MCPAPCMCVQVCDFGLSRALSAGRSHVTSRHHGREGGSGVVCLPVDRPLTEIDAWLLRQATSRINHTHMASTNRVGKALDVHGLSMSWYGYRGGQGQVRGAEIESKLIVRHMLL